MNDNVATIIITLISVLFGAGGWKFYEFLIKSKREKEKAEKSEQTIYRDDLRLRVEKLEKEKDDCKDKLLDLTQKVAALTVELTFIRKENDILKYKK
tara:strand:- start:16387 stop:16677 length:291 start_codon:yes stop_codon:yes gene_type:complete